jgi:hypothetical protein
MNSNSRSRKAPAVFLRRESANEGSHYLVIAALAFGLGVLNFCVDLWRHRVRLKLMPKLYAHVRDGSFTWDRPVADFLSEQRLAASPRICIEVQNIGHKPVSVSGVGFVRGGAERLCTIAHPLFNDGCELPRRLEPQSGFTAYADFTPEEMFQTYGSVDQAFAVTESDKCSTARVRS